MIPRSVTHQQGKLFSRLFETSLLSMQYNAEPATNPVRDIASFAFDIMLELDAAWMEPAIGRDAE
jgi:hypothetical protein